MELKLISSNRRSKNPVLKIANMSLSSFNSALFQLSHLEELNLENNDIDTIPSEICSLTNLRTLILTSNHIKSLPEAIKSHPSLKILDLTDNPVTEGIKSYSPTNWRVLFNSSETKEDASIPSFLSTKSAFRPSNESLDQQIIRISQGKIAEFELQDTEDLKKLLIEALKAQSTESSTSTMKDKQAKIRLEEENEKLRAQISVQPSTSTVSELSPSEIEIQSKIGQGGFSLIYSGRFNEKPVAIKEIFDPNMSQELKEEVDNELDKLNQLRHPNIINLYGVVKEAKLKIVTELASRGSLYTRLHVERENISQQEKISILRQLCFALAFCHSKGIIHRDIKSHNVLFDHENNVKLCDFGISVSEVYFLLRLRSNSTA